MNLNELDEAINDFKKVVLIEPTNQAALNRMKECWQQKIKAKKQSQEINNNKQSQEAKKEEVKNMASGCPKGAEAFIGGEGVKGQLISKCPFGVIVWTKILTIFFGNFCPGI